VKSARGDKEKQMMAKFVSRQVIAKYKTINKIKGICSWRRFNSSRVKRNFGRYERRHRKDIISDYQKDKVRQFFELDSNSRMCPADRC